MQFVDRRQPAEPRPRRTGAVLERAPQDPDVHFSAEKDITAEEIEKIKRELKEVLLERNTHGEAYDTPWVEIASKLVAPIAVLLPNLKAYLELDKFWSPLKEELDSYPEGNCSGLYWTMVALILLAPERRDELRQLSAAQRTEQAKIVNIHRETPFGTTFCRESIEFAVVYPDHIADLGLNEDVWNFQKQLFEENRERHEWKKVCEIGMFLRLCYPHRAAELELNPDEWDELKAELHHNRAAQLKCELAMGAAVLDAEKAEFTEEGFIKITPRQPQLKKADPLPDHLHV